MRAKPGERDAALDRRVAEDVLEVEREDEELGEGDGADDQHRHVGGGERPLPEDAHRQERSLRAQLDHDERDHEGRRRCEQAERGARPPAVGRRASERVDEQHQAAGDGGCAGEVEVAMLELGAAFPQQHRRERDRHHGDGNVDEEDPGPAQVRGKDAAEQDADRGAAAGCRTVDAERAVAVAALGEDRHQERERGRCEECSAEPLEGAERDQGRLRPGEAAQERARCEQGQARNEEASAAEQVSEPAPEQERTAEEDRVGGDHPLQALLREAEVGLDRRQRDVDNRDVEDDHELRSDDEREGAPAPLRSFSPKNGQHDLSFPSIVV